uniref:PARP-type domain-containing protein n=1 Tax=Panagrolaimus superbus TaxID=310955 RepID=A0A914Z669_9BILA
MTVYYCFQYALSGISNCGGCHMRISSDKLRVKRHQPIPQDEGFLCDGFLWANWFHFNCFWDHQGDEDMNIVDSLIQVEKSESLMNEEAIWFENSPYISLKNIVDVSKNAKVKIMKRDIQKIEQKIAKAKSHKTEYFTAKIIESEVGCLGASVVNWNCAYSNLSQNLRIRCRGNIYHPQCIKVCRKHSLDVTDIKNYASQTPERKKLIELLFEKAE